MVIIWFLSMTFCIVNCVRRKTTQHPMWMVKSSNSNIRSARHLYPTIVLCLVSINKFSIGFYTATVSTLRTTWRVTSSACIFVSKTKQWTTKRTVYIFDVVQWIFVICVRHGHQSLANGWRRRSKGIIN